MRETRNENVVMRSMDKTTSSTTYTTPRDVYQPRPSINIIHVVVGAIAIIFLIDIVIRVVKLAVKLFM